MDRALPTLSYPGVKATNDWLVMCGTSGEVVPGNTVVDQLYIGTEKARAPLAWQVHDWGNPDLDDPHHPGGDGHFLLHYFHAWSGVIRKAVSLTHQPDSESLGPRPGRSQSSFLNSECLAVPHKWTFCTISFRPSTCGVAGPRPGRS